MRLLMTTHKKISIDLPIEIYNEFNNMAVEQGMDIEAYLSHSLTQALTVDITEIYPELLLDDPNNTKSLVKESKPVKRSSAHLRII
mgnify:CR=1 FL=1